MNIQIKNRFTGAVLFEGEYGSLSDCVVAAVKAHANLADAYLADAYLTGANLASADLASANLARADLTDAYLADANLADADLADANLADANLADANLARADLTDAYLAGANLARADLTDAYLAGANLARADLARADLTDAYLAGANLARADLTGAYLAGANLARADLTGAKGVGETNGSEAKQPEPSDRLERQRLRAARFRERNPGVPVVESLDAKMLAVIESGKGTLNMGAWHTCETTHCRAGWAITLAGEAGKALEVEHGPHRAGAMIYRASTGHTPHFFATNEQALADIRAQAALQAQP